MRKKSISILLLMAFLMPLVSAGLSIEQPEILYNVGDPFNMNATIYSSSEISDYFTAKLLCTDKEVELHRSSENIEGEETKIIRINTKLDKAFIGSLTGTCSFYANYAGEEVESRAFSISDKIDVSFLMQGVVSSPGDNFIIEGQATKENGRNLEGFVDIEIEGENIVKTESVVNGEFMLSMTLPNDLEAKEYAILANAYEKDNEGLIVNSGEARQNITVKQIPKEMDIAIAETSIGPEDILRYTVLLYDQTGKKISQEVAVTIIKPGKDTFSNEVVLSDKSSNLSFKSSSAPGIWQIESNLGNLTKMRTFTITELAKIEYNLTNTSVVIKNIGNIPYTKPIAISIGDTKEVRELSIKVGEKQTLNLYAPSGEYPIKISTGQEVSELGRVFLTGNAAAVKEPGQRTSFQASFWFWIAIIVILAAAAIIIFRKFKKKGIFGSTFSSKSKSSSSSTDINKGEKREAAVLSLYVKNMAELESTNDEALEALEKIIDKAKKQAKVRQEGNYYLIVVPSEVDKETETIMATLALGEGIKGDLRKHNESSSKKILFGLGLHSGQIIAGKDSNNRVKFTAIGSMLTIAKRISSQAHTTFHISEKIHKYTVGKIKAEHLREKSVWNVKSVPNRGVYEKFIKGFLNRQKD